MKKIATNLLALLVFLLLSTAAIAQTGVGKISGKVIDADTKEPLIGANIILLNTNLGGATDIEGNYFILNITPGTYEVKVSYVGYASKTIQEVRIVANITYELDVALSTDFTLPEIIVEDKKLFEPTATNTVKVIDSEQISRIPVRGIANISSLQSGVVIEEGSGGQSGNASINVRGGRGSEVLYIIDGVPQNNLYNRGTVAQVSNVAIDQISFQVGGYEAKYGQAQSGIVSVTTKSGQSTYNVLADVISSTYTDDFGYNLYSGTISGPLIPGIPEHTFFFSGERQWNMDDNPPAIPFEFPTIEKSFNSTPDNNSQAWRISGKTTHRMGEFAVNLSGIYNTRDYKVFSLSGLSAASSRFIKNDSRFADGFSEENLSLNTRISQTVSQNTFWNVNVGYRTFEFKRFNPFFKDNLLAYGDSSIWMNSLNVHLYGDGFRTALVDENNIPITNNGDPIAADVDENGIFRPYGWSNGLYQRRGNDAINVDFDITSQIGEHLLEFGAGASQTIVRGYGVYAYQAGLFKDSTYLSDEEKFIKLEPFVYGYDATGMNKIGSDFDNGTELSKLQKPYEPILGYVYLQDRFELEDLVLNLGIRADYFDFKSYELVNPALPYANGSSFMMSDFKLRDAEIEISPRIGVGFPVTESTVFHAQYGRFIQAPELNDVYFGPYDYNAFLPGRFDPQSGFNGSLRPEETTQYELGFRQLFADGHAALNITAFYKNVKDLINVQMHQWREIDGGSIRTAIYPENSDFGTTRGLLFSLDITRLSYFSVSVQYTFQNAEGTGSSTSSSQTSVFRNLDNLPPKTIAPLSFDQKHTAIVNLDFYVPEGELGIFEMFNINALFSFNSGRPYTPVDRWNLASPDNSIVAENTGYINSAYASGSFRIDLKVEKTFMVGDYMLFAPYIWIENLLNTDNITSVYRSTGDPLSTGWLNTEDGRNAVELGGEGYLQDYISLERNPWNFGIPRLIKLGLKINFTNINL